MRNRMIATRMRCQAPTLLTRSREVPHFGPGLRAEDGLRLLDAPAQPPRHRLRQYVSDAGSSETQ
ncbi:hypothetical protein DF3PB_5990001 [uncultured Defluviicoccus sp.]|uniref:Uncharacterized protein n=1 Tax=metagenome TaxID=256318 RepID=A0A380TKF0_9ZZZZ|nr:hypothetical protein DF3PB_5990001 [uncultured Defluviicoccus sp.]